MFRVNEKLGVNLKVICKLPIPFVQSKISLVSILFAVALLFTLISRHYATNPK